MCYTSKRVDTCQCGYDYTYSNSIRSSGLQQLILSVRLFGVVFVRKSSYQKVWRPLSSPSFFIHSSLHPAPSFFLFSCLFFHLFSPSFLFFFSFFLSLFFLLISAILLWLEYKVSVGVFAFAGRGCWREVGNRWLEKKISLHSLGKRHSMNNAENGTMRNIFGKRLLCGVDNFIYSKEKSNSHILANQ